MRRKASCMSGRGSIDQSFHEVRSNMALIIVQYGRKSFDNRASLLLRLRMFRETKHAYFVLHIETIFWRSELKEKYNVKTVILNCFTVIKYEPLQRQTVSS